MHQDIRHVADVGGEEYGQGKQAAAGDPGAIMPGEFEAALQLGQCDAGEEDAGIGEWSVFKGANPDARGVAIDGAGDVVGIEVQVERVRNQADAPDGQHQRDQAVREIWARAGE